ARHGIATVDGHRAGRCLGKDEAHPVIGRQFQRLDHRHEIVPIRAQAVQPDNAGIGRLGRFDDQGLVGHDVPQVYQARDMNLPLSVLMRTTSPVSRYSGIWISRPLAKRAVLVRALAEEPLIAGGVSAIGISTTAGSSTPIRLPSTTRPYRPWMPSYR